MQVQVGTILEGKVTGIAAFGAFVELDGGKTGLVHISEISNNYVSDISQHIKEGDVVKVKVIGADNGKISLSIKQASENFEKPVKRTPAKKQPRKQEEKGPKRPPEEFDFGRKNVEMSFDDMLQKFKQDSDEKFQDLKRSNEGKRSGGYKRSY